MNDTTDADDPTRDAPTEYHDDAFRFAGTGLGARVSGIDHDGGRYCLPCARGKLGEETVKRYITDPKSVPAGGPVFTDTETDRECYCDSCLRRIETAVIGGETA